MTKKKTGKSNDILADLQASGQLVKMSDHGNMDVERIPTGILALDQVMSGGIPKGRIVEAFGPEQGGKSCLAVMLAGQAQKHGQVVYIDLENTLDPIKAENSDVDIDELFITQPNSSEETFALIHQLVKVPEISLIVVDSVAAMVPLAEINGEMGDSHFALQARVMSQGLRILNNIMVESESDTIVFFVNQVREKMSVGGYGPTTQSTGGRALRYFSSVRLDVNRIGAVKQGEDIIGQEVRVKVVKNKYSPPFRNATFKLNYTTGVSNESTIIENAVNAGFLIKNGAWYAKPGEDKNIAQGEPKMIQYLRDNPDYAEELKSKVLSAL